MQMELAAPHVSAAGLSRLVGQKEKPLHRSEYQMGLAQFYRTPCDFFLIFCYKYRRVRKKAQITWGRTDTFFWLLFLAIYGSGK